MKQELEDKLEKLTANLVLGVMVIAAILIAPVIFFGAMKWITIVEKYFFPGSW